MLLKERVARSIGVTAGCVFFIISTTLHQFHYKTQSKEREVKQRDSRVAETGHKADGTTPYLEAILPVWPIVITYQCLWIVYSVIALFRLTSLAILPSLFYLLWCASCCFDVASLYLTGYNNILLSWSCTCGEALFRSGCIFLAYHGLFEFLAAHSKVHKEPNKFDVLCQRVLLQNGLLCFQAWNSFKICLQFAQILQYLSTSSETTALCVSLFVFGLAMISWFLLQNFKFEKYTRFSVAEYITAVLLLGLFFGHFQNEVNGTFAFLLLVLCLATLICILRFSLVCHTEGERKLATDDELEFMM